MTSFIPSSSLYIVGFQVMHPLVSFPDLYSSFHNALRELHQYPQHAPEVLASVEAILSDGSVVTIPRRLYVESTDCFEDTCQALDWLNHEAVQAAPLNRMRYTGINFDAQLEQQAQRALLLQNARLSPLENSRHVSQLVEQWLQSDGRSTQIS